MFSRRFLFTALLAAAGVFSAPAVSQAAFSVTVSSSLGGSQTFTADPGDPNFVTGSVVLNGVRISVTSFNNSPGTPGNGTLSSNTIDIKNVTGNTSAQVITITSDAQGFATNPSPLHVNTELTAGTLLGSANGFTSIEGSHLAGSDVSTSGSLTSSVLYSPSSTPFTLGNTMKISLNATNLGTRINTTLANVTLDTTLVPAPAPAGLVLLLGAVPFVGLLRRALKRSAPATEAVAA